MAFGSGLRLTVLFLLALGARGEEYLPSAQDQQSTVFLPITVVGSDGRVAKRLDKKAFHLFEGSSEMPIHSFYERDVPASIGIILDLSGSMRRSVSDAQTALQEFFRSDPHDEAFLYAASSEPREVVGWSSDANVLTNGVALARAEGDTALYDTIAAGLKKMGGAHSARRAMLIISDGMDNHSRLNESGLLNIVRASNVRLFAIAVDGGSLFDRAALLAEKTRGTARLQDITESSGGFTLAMRRPGEMLAAAQKIGEAIRYTYVVGFEPASSSQPGKWQPVRIKVTASKLKVYAPPGYYAK